MVAFAMESYGGMGKEACRLLHTLAAHSRETMSPREFMRYAHRRIALTLQQANANLSLIGQQQLHLDRHANHATVSHPSFRYPLGAGHSGPRHTDRLYRLVDPELSAAAAAVHVPVGHSGTVDHGECGTVPSHRRGLFGMPMAHADVGTTHGTMVPLTDASAA